MKAGLILAPTTRSLVYLQVFDALGVSYGPVAVLPGEMQSSPIHGSVRAPLYQDDQVVEIDFSLSVEAYLQNKNIPYVVAPSNDVNDDVFVAFLKQQSGEVLVYSGMPGCILKANLLEDSGKRFIHAHGGAAPRYSGSTAFYYSLLEEGTIAATVFWMNTGLDTGDVIAQIISAPHKRLNLDHVQDSAIRAEALVVALKRIEQGEGSGVSQSDEQRVTYHVIHPVLKHLALKKIA